MLKKKHMLLSLSCINVKDIPVMLGNPKQLQLECLIRKTKLNSRQHGFQTHNHRHIKEVCKLFHRLILNIILLRAPNTIYGRFTLDDTQPTAPFRPITLLKYQDKLQNHLFLDLYLEEFSTSDYYKKYFPVLTLFRATGINVKYTNNK